MSTSVAAAHTPLYSLQRGGVPEVVIHGNIIIAHGSDIIFQTGGPEPVLPARSLLKPFQWIAGHAGHQTTDSNTARRAACMGSTSASIEQVQQLKEWYSTAQYEYCIKFLKVPSVYPTEPVHRHELKTHQQATSPFYNMCFSKHMGILDACLREGWEIEDYTSTQHPFHRRLNALLEPLAGNNITYVTDGCTLPSPVLSLSVLARLYADFAKGATADLLAAREIFQRHPQWIGGPGRVDTRLMERNHETVVAKEGADGLFAVGMLPDRRFPQGLGMVIKIWHGFYPQNSLLALSPILKALTLRHDLRDLEGQTIEYHYAWKG